MSIHAVILVAAPKPPHTSGRGFVSPLAPHVCSHETHLRQVDTRGYGDIELTFEDSVYLNGGVTQFELLASADAAWSNPAKLLGAYTPAGNTWTQRAASVSTGTMTKWRCGVCIPHRVRCSHHTVTTGLMAVLCMLD